MDTYRLPAEVHYQQCRAKADRVIPDRLLARLVQIPGALSVWGKYPVGSVETRVRYGIFDRPHYAYGVFAAADLARRLGIKAISAVEFGVAGGRGLLALERIAKIVGDHFAIRIHVAGFDSGEGMPTATDYRDLPYIWERGFYAMDVPKLKARLSPDTELILGDVKETIASWSPKGNVGFIAFDLDYYSSTRTAFNFFENFDPDTRLPRTYCYFDDIMWPDHACHNDYTGELCAIREFNEEHEYKKLCPINMFSYTRGRREPWNEQMYVLHDFRHPLYCTNITPSGTLHTEMPL